MPAHPSAHLGVAADGRVRWREPAVVFWALALGTLAMAALAPTRPWGWTGEVHLIQAGLYALFGWRAAGGLPGRARWPRVLAGAAMFVVVMRALSYLTRVYG